jgi:hypothetical protein
MWDIVIEIGVIERRKHGGGRPVQQTQVEGGLRPGVELPADDDLDREVVPVRARATAASIAAPVAFCSQRRLADLVGGAENMPATQMEGIVRRLALGEERIGLPDSHPSRVGHAVRDQCGNAFGNHVAPVQLGNVG